MSNIQTNFFLTLIILFLQYYEVEDIYFFYATISLITYRYKARSVDSLKLYDLSNKARSPMIKDTNEGMTKVLEIINNKGVKLHIFYPSELEFWTVVGKEGEYIQFEQGALCSCPAYFFNILRNNDETCYHIKALKLSKEQSIYEKIIGDDSEIPIFIKLLSADLT